MFDGAKIPDFIPIFAWRRARARAKALLVHGDVLDAV
ncbi:MAG: hypothetical protein ACXVQJ_11895 [Actinomycetota bacterium]